VSFYPVSAKAMIFAPRQFPYVVRLLQGFFKSLGVLLTVRVDRFFVTASAVGGAILLCQ
jgi:hypothetical protein